MNYMFCPKCGKVQPGAVTRFDHVICSECGAKSRLRQLDFKVCPECGSKLYAPKDRIDQAAFPCGALHAAQREEAAPPAAAQEELQEKQADAAASAAEAEEKMEGADAQPREEAPDAQAPLQIKWDPAPESFLHIYRNAGAIPPYSVLIVRENQEAVYCAGGATQRLPGGNTYPLFDDPRTEEEIMAGIYRGNASQDSLAYRLDTRIIFISKQNHDLLAQVHIALPGGAWEAELPCDVAFQVCEADNLLRNAGNYLDEEEITRTVTQNVQKAVAGEINAQLLSVSEDQAAEAKTAGDLKRLLADWLEEATPALCQRVNQRLVPRWGVRIAYLDIDCANALCRNIRNSMQAECPLCGHVNWVEKGARKAFACSECRARLSWCAVCGRFTASRRLSPEECAECGYLKFH